MIGLEEWVDVVALHRQGVPIKEIARRLDISATGRDGGLRGDREACAIQPALTARHRLTYQTDTD